MGPSLRPTHIHFWRLFPALLWECPFLALACQCGCLQAHGGSAAFCLQGEVFLETPAELLGDAGAEIRGDGGRDGTSACQEAGRGEAGHALTQGAHKAAAAVSSSPKSPPFSWTEVCGGGETRRVLPHRTATHIPSASWGTGFRVYREIILPPQSFILVLGGFAGWPARPLAAMATPRPHSTHPREVSGSPDSMVEKVQLA